MQVVHGHQPASQCRIGSHDGFGEAVFTAEINDSPGDGRNAYTAEWIEMGGYEAGAMYVHAGLIR